MVCLSHSYLPINWIIKAVLVRRLTPKWKLHYQTWTNRVIDSVIQCFTTAWKKTKYVLYCLTLKEEKYYYKKWPLGHWLLNNCHCLSPAPPTCEGSSNQSNPKGWGQGYSLHASGITEGRRVRRKRRSNLSGNVLSVLTGQESQIVRFIDNWLYNSFKN